MLDLESPRWSELHHAYGAASDIPALLRALEGLPQAGGDAEPWFTLWSALAHQGDVYPASFAAVPHVVRVLSSAPESASFTYFHFPSWVEICRQRKRVEVPADLKDSYFRALAELPKLVARAAAHDWDPDFLRAALGAVAAAKGPADVAEAAAELTPETAREFLQWLRAR